MLENKKLLIFDLDQTLIESGDIWNKVDEELVYRLVGKRVDITDIIKERDEILATCTENENKYLIYFDYIIKKYNLSVTPEDINKLNDDIALNMLRTEIHYKKDADTLLHELKKRGYILVLATTSPKYMIDIYLNENKNIIEKADMKDIFDRIYTRESVKELKPSSEIYLKILEDYNIDSKEALVFEDSLEGVVSAKGANIEVVAVYDKINDRYRKEINEKTDYQIDSFSQLLSK